METKTCAICKLEKPVDDFCFRNITKHQRCESCRECKSLQYKQKREALGLKVRYSVVECRALLKLGKARCPKCKVVKVLIESFCPNKASKTGFASHCRECQRELARELSRQESQKAKKHSYYLDKRLRQRDRFLRWRFGISLEEYNKLLTSQNGVCAICGQVDKNKALAVDHDHKTGRIRGLLCGRCNPALGFIQESPELIKKLLHYIEVHQCLTCQ